MLMFKDISKKGSYDVEHELHALHRRSDLNKPENILWMIHEQFFDSVESLDVLLSISPFVFSIILDASQ